MLAEEEEGEGRREGGGREEGGKGGRGGEGEGRREGEWSVGGMEWGREREKGRWEGRSEVRKKGGREKRYYWMGKNTTTLYMHIQIAPQPLCLPGARPTCFLTVSGLSTITS